MNRDRTGATGSTQTRTPYQTIAYMYVSDVWYVSPHYTHTHTHTYNVDHFDAVFALSDEYRIRIGRRRLSAMMMQLQPFRVRLPN